MSVSLRGAEGGLDNRLSNLSKIQLCHTFYLFECRTYLESYDAKSFFTMNPGDGCSQTVLLLDNHDWTNHPSHDPTLDEDDVIIVIRGPRLTPPSDSCGVLS